MTRERKIEILDLVMECNAVMEKSGKVASAYFGIGRYEERVYIFYNTDKPTRSFFYSTYKYYETSSHDGMKSFKDPDLKKAEKHLRELIKGEMG